MSIVGAGRAKPDRRRRWTDGGRKARRALIAEFAMRARVVVVMPVVFHHDTGFAQGPEQFPVEAFVPEPAVEAFHEPVLPRAAWIDIDRFDLMLGQPTLNLPGDELRAIVAAQVLGCAVGFNVTGRAFLSQAWS